MNRWVGQLGALLGGLCLAAVGGCRKPATGLRVLVTTDFAPSETTTPLASVILRVRRVGDSAATLALREEEVPFGPRAVTLPLAFNVFLATNAGDQVVIEAEAHTLASRVRPRPGGDGVGDPVTVARVITGFVEGEIRVVPMVLYRGCWEARRACRPDETCGPRAECEPARTNPATLPRLDLDAGDPTDVFTPAVTDATAMDATVTDTAFHDVTAVEVRVSDVLSPDVERGDGGARDGGATDAACPLVVRPEFTPLLPGPTMGTMDPSMVDLLRRPAMAPMVPMGGPPDQSLVVVWGEAEMMDARLARGVTVTMLPSGPMVTRSPEEMGAARFPVARALRLASDSSGAIAVYAPSQMNVGGTAPIGLSMSQINAAGAFTTTSSLGNSADPFAVDALQQGAFQGRPLAMGESSGLVCTPTTLDGGMGGVACVQFVGTVTGSRSPRSGRFSLPAGLRASRVAGMTVETASATGTLHLALELAEGGGVATCQLPLSGELPIMGVLTCTVRMAGMGSPVLQGSLAAQWIPGMICEGGWFVSFVQQGSGGMDTLRAGRFAVRMGASPMLEGLSPGVPVPIGTSSTTLSVGASTCQLLVANVVVGPTFTNMELRRFRSSGEVASARATQFIANGAAPRLLPLAQTFGGLPSRFVGVVAVEPAGVSGLMPQLFTVSEDNGCRSGM